MSRGRILVIRGGAVGDFILTVPALAALRSSFPQTELDILGYTHIASLATLGLGIRQVKSIEAGPMAGFFARRGTLDSALGEYFASFNIILSYLYDPDGIFQDNVARVSKAQFIAGPHRPIESEPVHATNVFLRPLERLAIFDADPQPRLDAGPVNGTKLGIHPGSGGTKKNWSETRWEEFLKRVVAETRWPVLIIGGEAEQSRVQRLSTLVPVERLTVCMHQPLTEVARRMTGCRAFVGHDSGITHLAAAVGLQGIALWGETNAEVWRPRSERFMLMRGNVGLQDIAPADVFARTAALMA